MYKSNLVSERIKYIAKTKNVSIKDMLGECGLSKNALSSMQAGGSMPKSENLAKIADYLDCSVDYLLGRVDTPNGTYTISNQNTTVSGTQANVINGNVNFNDSSDTQELLNLIESLPLVKRAEAIIYLNDLKTKK